MSDTSTQPSTGGKKKVDIVKWAKTHKGEAALVVVGGVFGVWYLFFRNKGATTSTTASTSGATTGSSTTGTSGTGGTYGTGTSGGGGGGGGGLSSTLATDTATQDASLAQLDSDLNSGLSTLESTIQAQQSSNNNNNNGGGGSGNGSGANSGNGGAVAQVTSGPSPSSIPIPGANLSDAQAAAAVSGGQLTAEAALQSEVPASAETSAERHVQEVANKGLRAQAKA